MGGAVRNIDLGCRRNLGIRTPKAKGIAWPILKSASRGGTPLYKLRRRRPALIAVGSLHWWVVDAGVASLRGTAPQTYGGPFRKPTGDRSANLRGTVPHYIL